MTRDVKRWLLATGVAMSLGLLVPLASGQQAAAPAAKNEPVESWYAATVAEDEKGQFLMIHFWSKGPRLRSEAVLAGRKIVTIVDPTTYYIIDDVAGGGISIERSEAAIALDGKRRRPFGNELDDMLLEGGELIGSEKASGQVVDVYRLTNDKGRRTIWMSTTKPPVPLRIETYDRATATTGKIDYTNWLYNPPIPDSFFEPDQRIELQRFTYAKYRNLSLVAPVGPAPVLYRHLLHGEGQPKSGSE